jgi:hypothetical protein
LELFYTVGENAKWYMQYLKKSDIEVRCRWLRPINLTTWNAEIRQIMVPGFPGPES